LKVPILTYHHIQPEEIAKELKQTSLTVDNGVFDQQMAYLAATGYTPIWANELVDALRNHIGLAGKPVMVTMDDGYADNYNYALPVLRKYNIKANLMLASGLVGSNSDMLNWDQINQMKSSGLFYFTNHTWSHYSITSGPQSKIESEIDTAQGQIQRYTGQIVNIFTYPYGSFNNNAIQILQSKGYVGAFSTIPGVYQCDSFIMALHRYRIGNGSLASYGL
jgi:peptidoglycan/xylan/chitin deacetylase (PgdA/CDA1 family)